MRIRIEGYDVPPGTPAQVRVGVQRLKALEQLADTYADTLTWDLEATVHRAADGTLDVRGPYVHGRRGDRFLYLSWGAADGAGNVTMFRRAKLMLSAVDRATIEAADSDGRHLVGRLSLTGQDGTPVCAAVRPPAITWDVG